MSSIHFLQLSAYSCACCLAHCISSSSFSILSLLTRFSVSACSLFLTMCFLISGCTHCQQRRLRSMSARVTTTEAMIIHCSGARQQQAMHWKTQKKLTKQIRKVFSSLRDMTLRRVQCMQKLCFSSTQRMMRATNMQKMTQGRQKMQKSANDQILNIACSRISRGKSRYSTIWCSIRWLYLNACRWSDRLRVFLICQIRQGRSIMQMISCTTMKVRACVAITQSLTVGFILVPIIKKSVGMMMQKMTWKSMDDISTNLEASNSLRGLRRLATSTIQLRQMMEINTSMREMMNGSILLKVLRVVVPALACTANDHRMGSSSRKMQMMMRLMAMKKDFMRPVSLDFALSPAFYHLISLMWGTRIAWIGNSRTSLERPAYRSIARLPKISWLSCENSQFSKTIVAIQGVLKTMSRLE